MLSPQYYFSQVRSVLAHEKSNPNQSIDHHARPDTQPPNTKPNTPPPKTQVKISVRPDAPEARDQVLCLEYKYPGAPKLKMEHPLLLRAHSAYQYFEPRNRFGPLLAQLSSPMTWMLLLSVLVAFYMPKMMDGLTEEEKARLQEQSNPSALFQELLGGGGGGGGAAGAGGARPAGAGAGAGTAGAGGGGGGGARG